MGCALSALQNPSQPESTTRQLRCFCSMSVNALRAFYPEFRGELLLRLEGSADAAAAAATPIAFESALAGVMLASEIVLDAVRETDYMALLPPR